MKVWILNDTAGKGNRHAGCELTMEAYKEMCAVHGIEVLGTVPVKKHDLKPYYGEFEKADLLIVNGEGSIHDNHRRELVRVANDFPSVLINCVWQNNQPIREPLEKFKYIAARESFSQKQLEEDSKREVHLVPDMVFAGSRANMAKPEAMPKSIGIMDSAFPAWTEHDETTISVYDKAHNVCDKIAASKYVITGRFHGIVLCVMLGVPFVAYRSNTWKCEAIMHDIGLPHLYSSTYQGARNIAPLIGLNERDRLLEVAEESYWKIREMWEKIASMKV